MTDTGALWIHRQKMLGPEESSAVINAGSPRIHRRREMLGPEDSSAVRDAGALRIHRQRAVPGRRGFIGTEDLSEVFGFDIPAVGPERPPIRRT